MASVEVTTVVSLIKIELSPAEARDLRAFFGEMVLTGAPQVVREIARKFHKAIEGEVFVAPVD